MTIKDHQYLSSTAQIKFSNEDDRKDRSAKKDKHSNSSEKQYRPKKYQQDEQKSFRSKTQCRPSPDDSDLKYRRPSAYRICENDHKSHLPQSISNKLALIQENLEANYPNQLNPPILCLHLPVAESQTQQDYDYYNTRSSLPIIDEKQLNTPTRPPANRKDWLYPLG